MSKADTQIFLSSVAVWEVRLKWHSLHLSGERKGLLGPEVMVAFAKAVGWQLLPLTADHATTSLAQPLGHKDPVDEFLLVQAQEDGMHLLTRDTKLIGHPFAAAVGQL